MPNSLSISKEDISQISDIATSYVQKDKSLVEPFMQSYYRTLHHEIADQIDNVDLAGMALHHFILLKAYKGDKPQLKILNPIAWLLCTDHAIDVIFHSTTLAFDLSFCLCVGNN